MRKKLEIIMLKIEWVIYYKIKLTYLFVEFLKHLSIDFKTN